MRGRRIASIILILFCISLMFAGCMFDRTVKADTPMNAAWLMKFAVDENNYDGFNNLFSKGRNGCISQGEFDKLRDITTDAAGYTHYELITFSNGKKVLVRLTPDKIDGEYKIEDVIIVPDKMKGILKN